MSGRIGGTVECPNSERTPMTNTTEVPESPNQPQSANADQRHAGGGAAGAPAMVVAGP